ncbi:MAG TPA: hypothetical protein VGV37_21930 [Aliidongia sp.]|uniref:low molecular weight protein tyrosine phosphatase family protein n=1 Tax=Aliidongia sp. TaxID=1914230 RepID=UPI002DDDAE8E|nr:hypothetical protein [Aliidongia sp.]HEV2677202.1 hypothetical protein [Aliidongia sp.]
MTRNVLFICGKNRRRSPTAEQIFADHPGIEVSSAGVSADADVLVTPELLEWAHLIFVMERTHRSKLTARFKSNLRDTKIVCLDIPDRYAFMDPELVTQLRAKVGRHL